MKTTAALQRNHAVVIGASITGLLTARVLADHFQHVTVLEQDVLPEGPVGRRGVPQAHHPHQLLARGCELFAELLPGLQDDLQAHGAICFDTAEQVRLQVRGNFLPRFCSGIRAISASRMLLDSLIRSRLRSWPTIRFQQATTATGLIGHADRIRGVLARSHDTGSEQSIEADLVIDASGRGSRAPTWLEALGLPSPRETLIQPGVGYCTRWYTVPAERHMDRLGDWVLFGTTPRFPSVPRCASMTRVENGQMLVSLAGAAYQFPPGDEPGFVEFVRHQPHPLLFDILQRAEPLSPIYKFRGGINRIRHYDRMPLWPEGFMVLGDAACVFNPIYGQGMTVAALSALLLGELLTNPPRERLSQRFQQRLARLHRTPWLMATAEDTLWALGESASASQRINHWMQLQALRSLFATREGTQRFYEIVHMKRSPLALLEPKGLLDLTRGSVARLRLG